MIAFLAGLVEFLCLATSEEISDFGFCDKEDKVVEDASEFILSSILFSFFCIGHAQ